MSDDLISRQYLQKQFQDKCETDCLVCDYDSPYGCRLIDNAPSATPEQTREWIPVSKKLPEDGTLNLFTDGKQVSVERYKADALDHFYPNGRWFSLDEAIA